MQEISLSAAADKWPEAVKNSALTPLKLSAASTETISPSDAADKCPGNPETSALSPLIVSAAGTEEISPARKCREVSTHTMRVPQGRKTSCTLLRNLHD